MESKELLYQEWIKRIGKERLQAYQDSFARTFGLSLSLLSVAGKTLTVWSNSSLFCHHMMKNNRARCLQERQTSVDYVLSHRKAFSVKCYMGLSFFMAPVFYGGEIICLAYGGGLHIGPGQIDTGHKLSSYVPVIEQKTFVDLIDLLQCTLELLDQQPASPVPAAGVTPSESVETLACESDALNRELNRVDTFLLKNNLSRRELEIARAVCECLGNKQIAEKLFISEKTVKAHVSNILAKLGFKDRMQILMFCRDHDKESK